MSPLLMLCASTLLSPPPAALHDEVGSLVGVSVRIDGARVPLHRPRDGSDRWYLEAVPGASYEVELVNRTGQRLGVVLAVDGLNVISGERQPRSRWWLPGAPGRMYVLDPWQRTTIRGWRTSLEEVQRFTFVDEETSYAARSGKANDRMGWIEVAVHRERRSEGPRIQKHDPPAPGAGARDEAAAEPPASAGAGEERHDAGSGRLRSFPGTGWGPRSDDPAVLVRFDAEPRAADRITLRYEYLEALIELGVLPRRGGEGRLAERDGRGGGFARAPRD